MPIDVLRYHYAVVCRIPDSFASTTAKDGTQLDLGLAVRQHNEYIEILRKLGIDVLELPADERHPECPFVADTAVVINGTALICKPSARRLGEVGNDHIPAHFR